MILLAIYDYLSKLVSIDSITQKSILYTATAFLKPKQLRNLESFKDNLFRIILYLFN